MVDNSRIAVLLVKYVCQDLSEGNREDLDAFRYASVANTKFIEEVTLPESIISNLKIYRGFNKTALMEKIRAGMGRPVVRRLWIPTMAAAVVIALLVLIGVRQAPAGSVTSAATTSTPFFLKKIPQSGLVRLMLGDRSVLFLDSMKDGVFARQGGMLATIGKDGRLLSYLPQEKKEGTPASSGGVFNTVTVPYGNRYRLQLPDGTKVALQVGSSLRFPVPFMGDKREVELNGEAFFEVARDEQHPFVVRTYRLTTEALGTGFDLQDYPDGPPPMALVQSGRIKVNNGKDTKELGKGQQLTLKEGKVQVSTVVNPSEELAWKDEYYNFDGLDIKTALRQLGKSYRMNVVFEKNIKSGVLGYGNFQRDLPLNTLLKDLELPDLHFEIRMQDSSIVVKR